jgi:hypothetical protein
VLAVGLSTALLYVVTSVDLLRAFAEFNSVREGSYGSRSAIYTLTWAAIQDLPFPLLGNGVKDRVPGLAASLGTHSSYLGLVYRGGWLAAAGLLMWLLALARRSWRAGSPLALGAAAFAAVWLAAEDLDVGHLGPLAMVLSLAAIRQDTGPTRSDTPCSPQSSMAAVGTGPSVAR